MSRGKAFKSEVNDQITQEIPVKTCHLSKAQEVKETLNQSSKMFMKLKSSNPEQVITFILLKIFWRARLHIYLEVTRT